MIDIIRIYNNYIFIEYERKYKLYLTNQLIFKILVIIKFFKMQILYNYMYYKLSENLNQLKSLFNKLIVFE